MVSSVSAGSVAATIASYIAGTTTKSNGCGVTSTTRSAPSSLSAASRSSETVLVITALPCEVGQTETHELGERADDDVGVLRGEVGDLVADHADRPGGLVLHEVRDVSPGELADSGGRCRHRIGLDLAGQHDVVTGLVEDDVVGELAQHGDGALPRRPADHDDTGVGEVARHLGLDATDRPLLEDVGEQ